MRQFLAFGEQNCRIARGFKLPKLLGTGELGAPARIGPVRGTPVLGSKTAAEMPHRVGFAGALPTAMDGRPSVVLARKGECGPRRTPQAE